MGRPRKEPIAQEDKGERMEMTKELETTNVMTKELDNVVAEQLPIDQMPLTSLREYRQYNEAAAKANKTLKLCRYPLKPCPEALHPMQRIIFGRVDQPSNPLKVFISNSIIHFDKTLVPGKAYDLPTYIVSYLAEKGTPVWKWRDGADGTKETFLSHKEPRFALRTTYAE